MPTSGGQDTGVIGLVVVSACARVLPNGDMGVDKSFHIDHSPAAVDRREAPAARGDAPSGSLPALAESFHILWLWQ
ncbi:hypothetical protein Y1Q_0007334 [Alligator mississippiensis]|uniref:Uncharacterized protein n=1 Tax=Alligator mississippiensis TaxID=8496 RepID=A0A151P7M6_ALLMI|nr:hypothetical protein Y1Q_0007334 [Alligator mississippiensis]